MISNQTPNHLKFDLEDRTTEFSKNLIDFIKVTPKNIITIPIINQVIKSGTSIGANYSEADEASSKRDFVNKINIAKKETKETKYWLKLLAHILPEHRQEIRKLWREAQELNLIFASIVYKSLQNKTQK